MFYHLIIFSFECDIAQRMIFKGERSGIKINFTMDVNLGYIYIEKFRGKFQWYMMESKDFISSISFKIKNEISQLVSFNAQSNTFRLSIKELDFFNIINAQNITKIGITFH